MRGACAKALGWHQTWLGNWSLAGGRLASAFSLCVGWDQSLALEVPTPTFPTRASIPWHPCPLILSSLPFPHHLEPAGPGLSGVTDEPGGEEERVGGQVGKLAGMWLPGRMRAHGGRWPQRSGPEPATEQVRATCSASCDPRGQPGFEVTQQVQGCGPQPRAPTSPGPPAPCVETQVCSRAAPWAVPPGTADCSATLADFFPSPGTCLPCLLHSSSTALTVSKPEGAQEREDTGPQGPAVAPSSGPRARTQQHPEGVGGQEGAFPAQGRAVQATGTACTWAEGTAWLAHRAGSGWGSSAGGMAVERPVQEPRL